MTAPMLDIVGNIAMSVQTRRRELKMSLDDVAARANLSKSHVWEIEQGRSNNPTISTALALCDALSMPLNDLLGMDVSQPRLTANELALIRAHRDIFGGRL